MAISTNLKKGGISVLACSLLCLCAWGSTVVVPPKELSAQDHLFNAAEDGDIALAKKALAEGASINEFTPNGMTNALGIALGSKQLEVAKFLLKKGADPCGVNPLMLAAMSGNLALVKEAEKKEPLDTFKRDRWGASVLEYAVQGGSREVLNYLVEKGAKVDSKNDSGMTPLAVAISENNPVMIDALISHGASTKVIYGEDHYTLFYGAVSLGNYEAVKALIRHGVDLNSVTKLGDSALTRAVTEYDYVKNAEPRFQGKKESYAKIIKLLRNAGAKEIGDYPPKGEGEMIVPPGWKAK